MMMMMMMVLTVSFSSILQFLSAMTGGTLGEGLAGNPNDYVFSQTALDNIITQLMEQAGG
jgi:E3 ubiquitin-protein ligase RNF115/126